MVWKVSESEIFLGMVMHTWSFSSLRISFRISVELTLLVMLNCLFLSTAVCHIPIAHGLVGELGSNFGHSLRAWNLVPMRSHTKIISK